MVEGEAVIRREAACLIYLFLCSAVEAKPALENLLNRLVIYDFEADHSSFTLVDLFSHAFTPPQEHE